MANKYCNLVGTNKIKDDWPKINEGFDRVQQDMEAAATGTGELQSQITTEQQARIEGDTALGQRISNIVAQSGDDITEIVDARQPVDGPAYPTLKDRLDATIPNIYLSDVQPSTSSDNAYWYEEIGDILPPSCEGDGLVIANAATDGSEPILFVEVEGDD